MFYPPLRPTRSDPCSEYNRDDRHMVPQSPWSDPASSVGEEDQAWMLSDLRSSHSRPRPALEALGRAYPKTASVRVHQQRPGRAADDRGADVR